jgi:homoserine kinase
LRHARVRVPGSTSNLGAGFDTIGLAIRRYLTASYAPGGASLVLERHGTLAALPAEDADDHLVRAFCRQARRLGVADPVGRITVDSEIPVCRGLGSSGAAIVAGLLLAAGAAGEQRWDARALLSEATQQEGHPDNVAAALHGGLVGIARDTDGMRAFRLSLSDHLGFAFAAPGVELSTPAARAALPATVPHAVAARALGRLVALLRGLATGEPEALRIGFDDELHVPYRLPLIPGAAAALDAARRAGAWAVTISGSGSGLIAVGPPPSAAAVAEAMGRAFGEAAGPAGVVAFATAPDFQGGRLTAEGELEGL